MNRSCSMTQLFWAMVTCLGVFLYTGTWVAAATAKLPVVQGKRIVAKVNGEPVFLDDLNQSSAASRAGTATGKKVDGTRRAEILQRLINARLVVQEARKMGLDDLPEIKNMVDVYSRATLREQLMAKVVKDIKPSKKEVEKAYQEAIKEWKISSIMFEKEDDAVKMTQELKAGQTFAELSDQLIAAGKAKGGERGEYIRVKEINPDIAAVVSEMTPGSVSPVIPVKGGVALVVLEDTRYSESPDEKESVERELLKDKRVQALKDFNKVLINKYAKVHKKVLGSVDYESNETPFEQLLKDKRVIAEIKGEKPITVGDLSRSLQQQLFHGVDQAIESKKLNAKKEPALEEILYRRVFRKEALRLGLNKSEDYKYKVKEYENSLIFGAFVQKAVVPDVKLKEEDLKAYYREHVGEYTLPEMMRLDSLAFLKRADAEGAIEALRKGTDFQWLLTNAEGQAPKDDTGLLDFGGRLLMTRDLPEDVQKIVSGSKPGDLRLYAGPGDHYYVISIRQVIPSRIKLYEESRDEIARKAFDDEMKKAVNEWTDKLRAASEVKIYLKNR